MNLEDLIKLYRDQSQDKFEPFFCGDELLTIYANEGQDEACRRGLLLRQSSGPMCQIAFAAGAELVPLHDNVLQVERAFVDGQVVSVVPVEYMDANHPGWQFDQARERPQVLISGLTTDALHLWPMPLAPGAIRLTVTHLPQKPMRNDADKPEIRREAHPALVDWMLYRAYNTTDGDLFDPRKAEVSLKRFEAEFGSKASLRNESWVRAGSGAQPDPLA